MLQKQVFKKQILFLDIKSIMSGLVMKTQSEQMVVVYKHYFHSVGFHTMMNSWLYSESDAEFSDFL